MSFLPPYVRTQSPEAEQIAIQQLRDISKREAAKMKLTREACLREMELAKQERQRIECEASNKPVPEVTEYDITQGLSIKNGTVIPQPESIPQSNAVIKTQQLSASFAELRNRK